MLTLVAATLITPSAGRAATLTVCASGCNYTTIVAAIAGSASGDTISITDSVHSESNIDISQNLTIDGQGPSSTVVDGGASGTVFTIDGGVKATIQNLTIQNGSGSSGGGIFNSGGGIFNAGSLTLSNSIVSGNEVFDYGAGIFNQGGTVTVSNSTISGNSAFIYGGGIYNEGGTVTLSDITLSGNSAFDDGGAIFNGGGTVAISGSTLSDNSADIFGGGIFSEDTTTLINSTLTGNSSAAGGAIFNSGALSASNVTVAGNSATSGGGIDGSGTTTIKNSIIGNNVGGDCGSGPTAMGANFDTDGTCGAINFSQVTVAQLNLGSLALNAPGTTETMALNQGSVAIDADPDCTDVAGDPVTIDQRGAPRPDANETVCDAGVYEFQDATPAFAGTPDEADCHGKSVSALSQQYGGLAAAASALGYPNVKALQSAIKAFCGK